MTSIINVRTVGGVTFQFQAKSVPAVCFGPYHEVWSHYGGVVAVFTETAL